MKYYIFLFLFFNILYSIEVSLDDYDLEYPQTEIIDDNGKDNQNKLIIVRKVEPMNSLVISPPNQKQISNEPIIQAIANDIKLEDIRAVKERREILLREQQQKLIGYKGNFKKVFYKEGFVNVNLRQGFVTVLSFKDELSNDLEIDSIAIGENNINIKQTNDNKLILSAQSKYFQTNAIVLLKDRDEPVHLNINEDLMEKADTEINIVIPNNNLDFDTGYDPNDNYFSTIKLKRQIIMELLKYNKIQYGKPIDYKIIDISTNHEISNYSLFSKIKFWKVERNSKKYIVSEIDNSLSIVGQSYDNFSRYNNSKTINFLDYNTRILMITNKKTDYSEDIQFIENNSIDSYSDFKRYKIILNH